MKQFYRDKRSPPASSANASRVMSSIKAKNTKPELIVRRLLWKNGFRGYRLHYKIAGKPDVVFIKRKIAIFINGCYWHRCRKCNLPVPKSNTFFWEEKFRKNIERDKSKISILKQDGWHVLIFWECELNSSPNVAIEKIHKIVHNCE
jgi:DNA mismatch endonuclease (patch repair protein)